MAHKVIDLFERIAPDYDQVLPAFAAMAEQTVALLPVGVGSRVLDLGAGSGAFTGLALERGARVTAIDAAPSMVARLRREHPAARSVLMDAHTPDSDDESFDVVVAGFVMHLMDDPGAAAAGVRRVLTPGGVFAFSTPGPPPGAPAEDDPFSALWGEFRAYLPPGSSFSRSLAQAALLRESGFTGTDCHVLSVDVPMPDGGQTLWRWYQTHGTAWTIDNLPPDRRSEFRERLIAEADAAGTRSLRAAATLWIGRRP
jgi:SAM-dependent methyltransferase